MIPRRISFFTRAIFIALVLMSLDSNSQTSSILLASNPGVSTVSYTLVEDNDGNIYVSGDFNVDQSNWYGVLWKLDPNLKILDSVTVFELDTIAGFSVNRTKNQEIYLVGRSANQNRPKGLLFFQVESNLQSQTKFFLKDSIYQYRALKSLIELDTCKIFLLRTLDTARYREGLQAFKFDSEFNLLDSTQVYSQCRDFTGFLSLSYEPLTELNGSIYFATGGSTCTDDYLDEVLKLDSDFELTPIYSQSTSYETPGWVNDYTFFDVVATSDDHIVLGTVFREFNLSTQKSFDSFQLVKIDTLGNEMESSVKLYRAEEEFKDLTQLIAFEDHLTVIGVDSGYSVTNFASPEFSSQIVLAEFNNDLDLLRSKKVDLGVAVIPTNAIKSSDGGLIICGTSRAKSDLFYQGFVVKFDKDLNVTDISTVGSSPFKLGLHSNPVFHDAVIQLPAEKGTLRIVNSSGHLVYRQDHLGGDFHLDMSNFDVGVYFVSYETSSGSGSIKLVKQ
ncbi:MAG TPA: T9SS type A sorting domain-containing protein [Luteibaculaceae bacterium]|nr:T9SS type A sorting domain-containing protein [Luteibaculaceae bacterium]